MLVVAVGAWGQITTTAPSTVPSGTICSGSSTGVKTTDLAITGGTCTSVQLRLDILSSGGATAASGSIVPATPGLGISLPAATYPTNASGNYSLQATIVGFAPLGCTPGAVTNGNTSQFAVTATPAAPTLTGTPIPTICLNGTAPSGIGTDGTYATCNGVGTLTVATAYTNTPSGNRDVVYTCVSGGCTSSNTTLAYTVEALPGGPTNAGTVAQQCINTLPVLTGATCPSGSEPVLIIQSTGAIAVATDFPTTAVKSVATACRSTSSPQCIDVAAAIYPGAAAGSAVGGNGYAPAATPTAPTGEAIAGYKVASGLAVSGSVQTSPAAGNTNTAVACSATGVNLLNFGATCASGIKVVYNSAGVPVWASAPITIGAVVLSGNGDGIAAPAASTTYSIACNTGTTAFCESPRKTLTYTVVTTPDAPTVAAIPDGCQDAPFTDAFIKGLATCLTGTVTVVTASPYHVSTTPGFEVGSVTYKCVLNGCDSDTKTVKYTIIARPSDPSQGAMLTNVCETGNTGTGMIAIASHNCAVGTSPYVTSAATGTTKLGLNGALFAQPTGTTSYLLFCQNDAGCSNKTGLAISGTVTPKPITPFNNSLSRTSAPCPTVLGGNTIAVNATCSGIGEQLQVFTTSNGTTPLGFDNAIPNAITTVNVPTPSETTTFYVQCKAPAPSTCVSDRVSAGTFTVGAGLASANATLKETEVCAVFSGTTKLTFTSNTCPTGSSLKVYSGPTGASAYNLVNNQIDVAATNLDAGDKKLYIVCTTPDGCESQTRTEVAYKINPYAVPTAAGNLTQQCANTLPILKDATCPTDYTPVLILSTGAIAVASDFPNTVTSGAPKSVATACKHTVTGCVTPWSASPYPVAAAGSAIGGSGYYPTVTPSKPTNPLIAAYKADGTTRVSTPSTVSDVATVCTAADPKKLDFLANCTASTVVVYDAETGGTPVWASAAIKLGAVELTASTMITPPAASKDYYIACNSNAPAYCESATRVKVSYVVVTTPDAPVSTTVADVCSGTTLTYAITCAVGDVVRYTGYNANTKVLSGTRTTGAAALTFAVPGANEPAVATTLTNYFVCETTTGACQSAVSTVSVNVLARPATPGVPVIEATNACDGMATIKSHSCAVGNDYFASTSPTGSPVLGLNGAPFNAGTANATFYVFCRNAAGCLSASTVTAAYAPKPKPVAPATISLSKNSATCPTTVATFTITATCSGATTDELVVYTAATGGTALAKETSGGSSTTVSISGAKLPTETTTYYVACESPAPPAGTGCKSDRVLAGTYTVGAGLAPASVTLVSSTVCQNPAVAPVVSNDLAIATNNCPAGTTLKVYKAATGGATYTIAPITLTSPNLIVVGSADVISPVGGSNIYVVCRDAGGCESGTRTAVPYTVVAPAGSGGLTKISPAGNTVCSGVEITLRVNGGCNATDTQVKFFDGTNTLLATLPIKNFQTDPLLTPSLGAEYVFTLTNTTNADKDYEFRAACNNGVCDGPINALFTGPITVRPAIAAPVVTLTPGIVCGNAGPTALLSNSTCGTLETVWYNASTDQVLASLPTVSTNIPGTYSYYAKCKRAGAGNCEGAKSNVVSYTVVAVLTQPTITSSASGVVCAGTPVTFTSNCPAGSTAMWSTGATGATITLTQSTAGSQSVTVKCTQGPCESPVSAAMSASWSNTFDVTIINVGQSLSGTRPGATSKLDWSSNFVVADAGAALQNSTSANPSIFYTEKPNKGAERYWTVAVEACGLPLSGSISYDMLCMPETGGQYSYNTVENNAPYLMYANSNGYETLFAHNHGSFGFTSEPKYAAGLPKGLYKLSIRYWDQKGTGLFPAVRTTNGNQLAYGEYWFRIQSQAGIGAGGAREGVSETSEVAFATVAPNPVTRTLTLAINGAKGQEVKMNLVDAAGRIIKTSTVTPETNTHREEVDMSNQTTGMYFMNISTPTKRANLKVLKVSND